MQMGELARYWAVGLLEICGLSDGRSRTSDRHGWRECRRWFCPDLVDRFVKTPCPLLESCCQAKSGVRRTRNYLRADFSALRFPVLVCRLSTCFQNGIESLATMPSRPFQ